MRASLTGLLTNQCHLVFCSASSDFLEMSSIFSSIYVFTIDCLPRESFTVPRKEKYPLLSPSKSIHKNELFFIFLSVANHISKEEEGVNFHTRMPPARPGDGATEFYFNNFPIIHQ